MSRSARTLLALALAAAPLFGLPWLLLLAAPPPAAVWGYVLVGLVSNPPALVAIAIAGGARPLDLVREVGAFCLVPWHWIGVLAFGALLKERELLEAAALSGFRGDDDDPR